MAFSGAPTPPTKSNIKGFSNPPVHTCWVATPPTPNRFYPLLFIKRKQENQYEWRAGCLQTEQKGQFLVKFFGEQGNAPEAAQPFHSTK